MFKERVGAEQLADMIARKINVAGVEIGVREDHAFGGRQRFCRHQRTQSASNDGQTKSLDI
jgi:hypothetical protein